MRDWLINLPSELTETDLIEMVEGTLPAHREPIAIAALKAEPRLGLLIKQLRADREAAAGLAVPESAPKDVGERVLSVIDRRMIRELDEISQQQTQHIPVSTLTIHEPTVLEILLQSAWTKRLAVAAALMIVAGVGYLGVRLATAPKDTGTGSFNGQLAKSTTGPSGTRTGPGELIVDGSGPSATTKPTENSNLAMERAAPPTAEVARADETNASGPANTAAGEHQADVAPLASAEPSSPQMTASVAARLAREGRLAIVVHCSKFDELTRRAQSLAKASPLAGAIACRTVAPELVPAQAMALVASSGTSSGSPSSAGGSSPADSSVAGTATTVADPAAPDMSLNSIAPELKNAAQAAPLPAVPKALAPAFIATVDPSEQTLEAVKRFLEIGESAETTTQRFRVEFRVMETPVEEPISFSPESILWWNSPAARWARLSSVPIVVDQSAP